MKTVVYALLKKSLTFLISGDRKKINSQPCLSGDPAVTLHQRPEIKDLRPLMHLFSESKYRAILWIYFFSAALLLIFGVGIFSYHSLKRKSLIIPTMRKAVITASYPKASALMVENHVTECIENAIKKMTPIPKVHAISQTGLATVMVDISGQPLKVWESLLNTLSTIQHQLPLGVSPSIMSGAGSIFFALTGEGYSAGELKSTADLLKKEILPIKEVERVTIWGEKKMDLNSLIIQHQKDGTPIHLGDVATIKSKYVEPQMRMMRYNGRMAIGLDVTGVENTPLMSLGRAVKKQLKAQLGKIPVGMRMSVVAFCPVKTSDQRSLRKDQRQQIIIDYERPKGTPISKTFEDIKEIETYLSVLDGVKTTAAFIGESPLFSLFSHPIQIPRSHFGQLVVMLKNNAPPDPIMKELRYYLETMFPNAKALISQRSKRDDPRMSVRVQIQGPELEELKRLSHMTRQIMERDNHAMDIMDDMEHPLLLLKPKEDKSRSKINETALYWEDTIIHRKNFKRTITVQCSALNGDIRSLYERIKPIIENMDLKKGYTMRIKNY